MAESICVENEQEKLIALQAIETYRALQQAVKTAPHGKGLATVEAVVHDKGFDHLRQMYQSALAGHPEAQKRALLLKLRLREEGLLPLRHAQAPADDHRRHCDPAALLRLPKLCRQADALGRLGRAG